MNTILKNWFLILLPNMEVVKVALDNTKGQTTASANEKQLEPEKPEVLEEIVIEELSVDGICGVY